MTALVWWDRHGVPHDLAVTFPWAQRREVAVMYDTHRSAATIERLRPSRLTRAIYRIREWRARP